MSAAPAPLRTALTTPTAPAAPCEAMSHFAAAETVCLTGPVVTAGTAALLLVIVAETGHDRAIGHLGAHARS